MKPKRFNGPHPDKAIKPIVDEETAKILDAPAEKKEEPVPVIEEEKEELVEAEVDGVINGLNIRSKPEVKANNQIAILGKGVRIVVVDPKKTPKNNGEEWYKVRLDKDADPKDPTKNGWAMKKYIKIL